MAAKKCRLCKQQYSNSYALCDNCREMANRRLREWRKKNPTKRREYYIRNRDVELARSNRYNRQPKILVWEHYFGGQHICTKCLNSFPISILHLHHNKDGREHKKELISNGKFTSTRYYKALVEHDFPDIDVSSLCPTCHALTHMELRKNDR